MRRALLLLGVLLMADFLGGASLEDQGGEVQDYLGRLTERAFKSPPALPAGGGPAPGVAAAPTTIGGAGTAAPAVSSAGGGGGGVTAGPTTLAQIARALGLSVEALKTSDWARKLFGDKPSAAPPTSQAFLDEIARGEVPPGDFDPQLAALVREAMAGEAGAAGTSGGLIGGGVGLGGILLGELGRAAGNRDVSRAGSAVSAAGTAYGAGSSAAGAVGTVAPAVGAEAAAPSLSAALGGAAYAFAPAALGYTGMSLAKGFDQEAQIRKDIASAKNVLGAKVPSAVSRLGKTLTDISSLDPASATTEQLLAAQNELQGARQEFNAIDHAFKGGVTIAGKPIDTGLSLDMVKPQLDALNESQLRIQDALESRGVQSGAIPGYQSPQDWLNFLDSPLYQQYTTGTPRVDLAAGTVEEPADLQNPEIAAALKGIQPGQTESGLRQLIGRGLPARVPRPAPEALVGPAFGGEDFSAAASAIDAP